MPYPVLCTRRPADQDLVSLTGVRPDGVWLGHDEDGMAVRVRLPEVVTTDTTEEYLGELCETTRLLDGMVVRRASSCTKA